MLLPRLNLEFLVRGPNWGYIFERQNLVDATRDRTGGNARFELILAEGSDAQVAAERYEPRPLVRNLERLPSKVISSAPRRGPSVFRSPLLFGRHDAPPRSRARPVPIKAAEALIKLEAREARLLGLDMLPPRSRYRQDAATQARSLLKFA